MKLIFISFPLLYSAAYHYTVAFPSFLHFSSHTYLLRSAKISCSLVLHYCAIRVLISRHLVSSISSSYSLSCLLPLSRYHFIRLILIPLVCSCCTNSYSLTHQEPFHVGRSKEKYIRQK